MKGWKVLLGVGGACAACCALPIAGGFAGLGAFAAGGLALSVVGLVDEPDRPCAEVRDIAAVHLEQVRRKMAELRELEDGLSRFVASCNSACAGGAALDCTILEDLALDAHPAPRTGCCS